MYVRRKHIRFMSKRFRSALPAEDLARVALRQTRKYVLLFVGLLAAIVAAGGVALVALIVYADTLWSTIIHAAGMVGEKVWVTDAWWPQASALISDWLRDARGLGRWLTES